MTAFYNEIDPYAAAWLRNLIAAGHIAPGVVDERSIEDINPEDLRGFTQCHFFAGIGVWSYALRLAGWSDDRAVWTGSCPCQPFSAAGKGGGTADERHLWPAFFHLIQSVRPPVVFGEQVASKGGLGWLDLVQADLEGSGYAVGAADLCAAGIGAPHIRQRLYWVADSNIAERRSDPSGRNICDRENAGREKGSSHVERRGGIVELADPQEVGRGQQHQDVAGGNERSGAQELEQRLGGRSVCAMGHPDSQGLQVRECPALVGEGRREEGGTVGQSGRAPGRMADTSDAGREWGRASEASDGRGSTRIESERLRDVGVIAPGRPTNGHWRATDWLYCRDGKWRPVEPGTFPLAHGAPARVGRLRAYGNAIVAETFIRSAVEAAVLREILQ